jgi:hypothetical protein
MIFRSYEEEYAEQKEGWEESDFAFGEDDVVGSAEACLSFASGVSVVCSYSDALGGSEEIVIPEPEWG